jgi:hypothetical protein
MALLLRLLGLALVALLGLLAWWWLRPNRARVHPLLQDHLEHWDVVADGQHNSNTDMIAWNGGFLLVHAASPYHLGTPRCRLVVRRSADGRRFEELAVLRAAGKDIRDPKLALIGGRLFLYALTNEGVMATPSRTVLATSDDAVHWSPFEPVGPEGWLFWRPKTRDGETWYVPAYWHEHGASRLLRSRDGVAWETVSTIHEGEANDETAIEFLPDGRMLATARLEVTPDNPLGHEDAGTLLAVAEPPYTEWRKTKSAVTRLDGPALFPLEGRVFAVARHQPGPRGALTRLGGVLSRKRTALYEVKEDRLLYLSDLPSAGDTSYAGVVLRDGHLFADYYTSDVRRDFPWILGMFLRSDIRMARLPLARLLELADAIGP